FHSSLCYYPLPSFPTRRSSDLLFAPRNFTSVASRITTPGSPFLGAALWVNRQAGSTITIAQPIASNPKPRIKGARIRPLEARTFRKRGHPSLLLGSRVGREEAISVMPSRAAGWYAERKKSSPFPLSRVGATNVACPVRH